MAFPEKNYTKGSGKLFFHPFVPGSKVKAPGGQRYIGNTPSVNAGGAEIEALDHYDSDNGTNEKDFSVNTQVNRAGSFVTDHINPDNLAHFFIGEASNVTLAGATDVVEPTIEGIVHGQRYQLGVSASVPTGARNLANVAVTVTAVAKVEGVDYTVDLETGGIVFLATGTIADGADVDVTYDVTAGEHVRVISGGTQVEGELMYIAKNVSGRNIDHVWPDVILSPDGDYELKGDTWQELAFSFSILKRDDLTAAHYINGRVEA